MSRLLRRSRSNPDDFGWIRLAAVIAAAALAGVVTGGALALAEDVAPPDEDAKHLGGISEDCGPFGPPRQYAQLGPSKEPGVTPGSGPRAGGSDVGQIITLPTGGSGPPSQVSGEAILALPKDAGGQIPTDFELGPDARLVESFFSPVLCATVARVKGPEGMKIEELVPDYPDTAALVPHHVYATAQAETTPVAEEPDPYRKLQWGLEQTGVERARSISSGAGIRVAILDSIPQTDHRDLGPIRVVRVDGGPGDAPGAHGTLVTGLVDATPDNGFGIAGVAPGAEIIAIPVCTPAGSTASAACGLFTVLRGLDKAWSESASIVNLSIVGPENPLLARGMQRLDSLGILVVAAAGNEGTSEPRYPAAYGTVIGVGAIDRDGKLFIRSNRGLSAELMAPGVEVLSAVPGDAFSFGSGTSFAAAHVTGSLAVLLGAQVEPFAARAAMFETASAIGSKVGPTLPPICDVLGRLGRPCPE